MSQWTELQIKIPVKNIEKAAAIAQMVVPYGIYIEDYSALEAEVNEIAHIDLIDKELLDKDRNLAIVHIYLEPDVSPKETLWFLEERLTAESIEHTLNTSNIKEEDWATVWQKYYHPTRIGQRLIVCPVWEEVEAKPQEIKLLLNPGMAFGTGTHETTRLCLAQLERLVGKETDLLDVGCGSGILSIASVLLGARSAVGVDIDPLAVKIAKENASINNIPSDKISFLTGDLTDKVSGKYDLITANIIADAIIELSKTIVSFLKPGGIFLCSGIIRPRTEEVLAALKLNGLKIEGSFEENDWFAIAAKAD